MDTNKIMLQSIIAPPEFRTLSNYKDKLNKLSYLSKKQYNMVEEFYFNYYKEVLEIAVEHGLNKLFELGFSSGELYNVFAHLNRNTDFKIFQEDKNKLMNDCDKVANWIRENVKTTIENERLTHDTYHKLSFLYSTIKAMKTKD